MNVPPSAVRGDAVYRMLHYYPSDVAGYLVNLMPGNFIDLLRVVNGSVTTNQGIHPLDAYAIDSKLDDGLSQSGRVKSQYYSGCVKPSTGAYNVTVSEAYLYCRVLYHLGY